MTNFLVHPCLHKIIVQPLAVFRQSPSPFTSFEGMEHCRVTLDERGTKTTRGNSRRESVRESEGVLACLVPNAPLISRSIKRGAASSLGTNIT